jgi:hypothetical protein
VERHPSSVPAYSGSDETPSVSGQYRVRWLWYFGENCVECVMEGNVILELIFKDDLPGPKIPDIVERHPSPVPAYSGSDETPSVSGQCRVCWFWYFLGEIIAWWKKCNSRTYF